MRADQQDEITPHKYLARDYKSELEFNRKIKIKAIVQKHWIKLTKVRIHTVGQCGGSSPIKQWIQPFWNDECDSVETVIL